MKQVPVLPLQQSAKAVCADMLTVAGWPKKWKREVVRHFHKKYLKLGFTVAL